MPRFFATCATRLEYLLVDELKELGAESVKEGLSLVHFDADWKTLYGILMWSRIASRVLYPIAEFEARDEQTLYDQVSIIDWSQHLNSNSSFLIHSQSYRSDLSHTKFISQRIKDAIVDHFKELGEQRPDVAFEQPDVSIQCRIRQNKVVLSIDLAGIGLHHRGYRLKGGAAPIKENLAAALLVRAGWQNLCKEPEAKLNLYDPMCGSGTFLIEAAMMALDIAPGLYRDYLGITGWKQFNSSLWERCLESAKNRKENNNNRERLFIQGSDKNPKVVRSAQSNLVLAELEQLIKIHIAALDQIEQIALPSQGVLIVNPPYSERLGEAEHVKVLYGELGELLKNKFLGWNASVLSPNKQFGHAIGIRAKKIYKFNNGSIPCELLNLEIKPANFVKRKPLSEIDKDFKSQLSAAAIQVCNRIEKNRTKLKRFINNNKLTCYRIYDADLPEYNAAIDVYQDKLHIQEYRPPKSVDEKIALRRIKELQRVAAGVFQLPLESVYLKQRRQQKGNWQYDTKGRDEFGVEQDKEYFVIEEAGRKFRVNLRDYLDTGLFLDHRKTRTMISKLVAGKRFLNLFCYTSSFSVYAATAGAKQTVNVDLSNTYLNWSKENFKLNNIKLDNHFFYREDSLTWLNEAALREEKFDVILLDPPTFSNSKKMDSHFDVQKDHLELIKQCIKLLNPKGILIFSNNFTQFKMEYNSSEQVRVTEITKQTTSEDFFRKPLHRCWKIELI